MGNSWFQFREFRIEQGRSAMKVCTDSCIFGALAADRESRLQVPPSRILDLGCGTGLLSLMMAQAIPAARISGIELHSGSAADCRDNFASSLWHDRLHIEELDFHLMPSVGEKFDCIICNPPFFLNHLRSPDQGRNQSMHNTALEWNIWMQLLSDICHPEGRIWLLLDPGTWDRTVPILGLCGFFVREELTLVQSRGRIWRNMVCLSKEKTEHPVTRFLDVYENPGTLSTDIRHWLYDYYL